MLVDAILIIYAGQCLFIIYAAHVNLHCRRRLDGIQESKGRDAKI